jgi:hypothetical protein
VAKVTGVVMVSIKSYYKGGTMGLKVGRYMDKNMLIIS